MRIFPKEIPIFSVGFSLGESILLKYLGTHTHITPLKAAVAISPPWNFHILFFHFGVQ